ncbi:hypothetical protein VFPPC_16564 [Pochonia chlamydosporia 170]|uniref:Uncharacterized protein n=1 Tax=Pochonia chlamydosporia 170 TaxID=1380566 RepID=A0A179F8M3_METCM|nr:hypothetical protein VFPPC_16564 [Pochonia chlamydosporia 170]OAQ61844.2 hypothetical protein VFPPC_16564 [Pochonia chlamydosporia 170]
MCRHEIDEPSVIREYADCKDCGEVKTKARLGISTIRTPCDDCKESGAWEFRDGWWQEVESAT